MTERGRNRLVGAVILLSLAVILLPMLFDGAGIERRSGVEWPVAALELETLDERFDQEPDHDAWAFADEVETRRRTPTIRGQPEHLAEPVPEAAVGADHPPAADEGAVMSAAGLDERSLPRAFSVQLAAFRDPDNARALRQRLLDDGYDAYMIEEGSPEGRLHRVAVGPRIDRAAAIRLQGELATRYDLQGLVVRFSIASAAGRQDG